MLFVVSSMRWRAFCGFTKIQEILFMNAKKFPFEFYPGHGMVNHTGYIFLNHSLLVLHPCLGFTISFPGLFYSFGHCCQVENSIIGESLVGLTKLIMFTHEVSPIPRIHFWLKKGVDSSRSILHSHNLRMQLLRCCHGLLTQCQTVVS